VTVSELGGVVSEWLFSLVIATVICAAAALGIIEIRWTSKQTLLKRLAQLLRDASHHLDAGTPGLDRVVTSDHSPPNIPSSITGPQNTPPVTRERIAYRGSETGWYNVLPARDLIRCIEGDEVISKIIRATRFAPDIFAHDLQPALLNFAEFVQLLPASESHHHANPGGLLAHTLETVLYALTIRTGYLLPLGAGAEVIAAQRDFWTYAVFLAALLHDVGKPMADLKIQWKRGRTSEPTLWSATAGSLNDCAATEYFVGFKKKSERNYDSHAKLGAMLLQRLVPGSTLASMAHVPAGLQELNQYLGGERSGALHEIVQKADQESTRRNLATGSRARFSSARAVPLIERLMGAMTLMFVEGGHLPLNRDGAAGWVYDNCLWLVAKRLADSVREFILRQEEDEEAGFPGDAKNDRLFDAWQEYGCIRINPVTGQAIWRVVVTGTDQAGEIAYKHELSVLCFPVAKVWSDPSQIPEAMSGMIEALPAGSQGKPNRDQQSQRPVENGASASVSGAPPTEPIDAKKVPAPKFVSKDSRAMKNSETTDTEDLLDERDTAEAEARNARRDKDRRKQEAESEPETVPAHQNDAEDNESEQSVRQESMPHATSSLVFPVPLPIEKLPVLAHKGAKEPSALAIDFMKWVQRNLADGSMKHNEAGAPVHFIEYGMALVSPLIFRLYATATEAQSAPSDEDGDFAMRVQRELLRAQWHATAPGGKNVWTLFVSKKGGLVASKLSAVVLKDPRLWVMPVPPPNPFISAKSDSSERQP
jgi:integrating conjugative element relaxase (TIGR03760 family)